MTNLNNQLQTMRTEHQQQIQTIQDRMTTIQQAQHTPSNTKDKDEPMDLPPLPNSPLPAIPVTTPTPSAAGPTGTHGAPSIEKKKKLPDPPKFSGLRHKFRPWYLEMKHKLKVDGSVIGGHMEQFAYIYARLDDTPQGITSAFVEAGGRDGLFDPNGYLLYLHECYGDPNAQARAVDRLRTMRQRENESFAAFLPRFEKELADSGGGHWEPDVCINYLEGALNHKLRDRLISIPAIPTKYNDYVRTLQTIGSRLDSLKISTRQYTYEKGQESTNVNQITQQRGDQV